MEHFNLVFVLGIMFCLANLASAQDVTVAAGSDITVRPTPTNPSPQQMVNVTLECAGSRTDLTFYIKNRVIISYFDYKGTQHDLVDGFYPVEGPMKSLFEGEHPHYASQHTAQAGTNKQMFNLEIFGVTHKDDGTYRCQLVDGGNKVLSEDTMRLTVLNPVTNLKLEVHDMHHTTVAQSSLPIDPNMAPTKLTSGHYMVKCTASGSNPEPVMSLLFNEEKPYIAVNTEKDTSGDRVKYIASFMIEDIHMKPKGSNQQTLVCSANIKDGNYPAKEAGLLFFVDINKPNFNCDNLTLQEGNRYQTMECSIFTEHGAEGLSCDKVVFEIAETSEIINIGQETNTANHDIMEATCRVEDDRLVAELTLFHVRLSHFDTIYYVQYGSGEDAHRHPFNINYKPTSTANFLSALSVCFTIMVALLSTIL